MWVTGLQEICFHYTNTSRPVCPPSLKQKNKYWERCRWQTLQVRWWLVKQLLQEVNSSSQYCNIPSSQMFDIDILHPLILIYHHTQCMHEGRLLITWAAVLLKCQTDDILWILDLVTLTLKLTLVFYILLFNNTMELTGLSFLCGSFGWNVTGSTLKAWVNPVSSLGPRVLWDTSTIKTRNNIYTDKH